MNQGDVLVSSVKAVTAARRAADVVAVLHAKDHADYATLVRRLQAVLRMHGEADLLAAVDDFDALKSAATALYAVFAAPDDHTAAAALNALCKEYVHTPRLQYGDNEGWRVIMDSGNQATWAEQFAVSSALALAVLFAEKQRNPAGLCASSSCGKPFIDSGKGGKRSYCSPRCATRERVSAYRQAEKNKKGV